MDTKILKNILVSYYPGEGTFWKIYLLWGGGWVSDPQNCKIQKIPGYFLKTILGLFFYLFDGFSMKIRGGLTLSLLKTHKFPCTFNQARQFDVPNSKDLKNNVSLSKNIHFTL